MRTMVGAALIGLAAAGGAMIAGSAQAQPYGYYSTPSSGYYDSDGYYHSTPSYGSYYSNPGYYTTPSYTSPSYYGGSDVAGLAGALIGSVLGNGYTYGQTVPVDRYGPDPNGMLAPDGHRIKCKLRTYDDDDRGYYVTRRECY